MLLPYKHHEEESNAIALPTPQRKTKCCCLYANTTQKNQMLSPCRHHTEEPQRRNRCHCIVPTPQRRLHCCCPTHTMKKNTIPLPRQHHTEERKVAALQTTKKNQVLLPCRHRTEQPNGGALYRHHKKAIACRQHRTNQMPLRHRWQRRRNCNCFQHREDRQTPQRRSKCYCLTDATEKNNRHHREDRIVIA